MLFDELKRYLKITWDDEDQDIQDLVDGGKAYLNEKAGVELDFENDLVVKQLLKDYGRYVYNHSLEMFEHNFQSQLTSLIIREGVKDYALAEEDTETST